MKPRRPRRAEDLEKKLNLGDHFDPAKGVGKDPHLSGPRADESEIDLLGADPAKLREDNPREGVEPSGQEPAAKNQE